MFPSSTASAFFTAAESSPDLTHRHTQVALARSQLFDHDADSDLVPKGMPQGLPQWLWRSWQRCLQAGRHPRDSVEFEAINRHAVRQSQQQSAMLIEAARPVMTQLVAAVASLRYFCLLTNQQGTVLEVQGPVDAADRRAQAVGRVGVDLSESGVGTSAIGATLAEQAPVWLHQHEHFFEALGAYSCAGAPIFDPQGQCIGMLDITGIDVPERPELMHLALRCARAIEDRLLRAQPHALLLHINWPGGALGQEGEGLLALDEDGVVLGSNAMARQLVPRPLCPPSQPLHCAQLIALPWPVLYERALQRPNEPLPIPLWSGLRLHALAQPGPLLRNLYAAPKASTQTSHANPAHTVSALKTTQQVLIQQALADARGNVSQAAKALGIGRATLYRKLAPNNKLVSNQQVVSPPQKIL